MTRKRKEKSGKSFWFKVRFCFFVRFATVLAFDVKILPEAQQMADQNGIKIFTANIIYHLFDQFMAYVNEIRYVLFDNFIQNYDF